ncbi:cytochrome P450 [Paraconexibacter antarcticus]|uniref:Cytochrome P450 n=1 Tax=Paraconexibacter antarcticus TaxID=2949664 RepID=A0ABY5DZW7_9ACTN|nr:cytochrome P450 [Paraconexibacter antarcticus]UTI66162.1 cytochrome P450 [Paraconexibacter antarcticus]
MSSHPVAIEDLRVGDDELWAEGPPHETFSRLRAECPVHWSSGISQSPEDAGFWSVTKADDILAVSRDWQTYSSAQNIIINDHAIPVDLVQGMFIGMDPPKHDRIKSLFQRAFTPKAIAAHETAIREITGGVMDGLAGRETCDLVTEVAQPVVSRVIGSFMGLDEADDEPWATAINTLLGFGDPGLNPKGLEALIMEDVPLMYERCMALVEARRANPTEDMLSVLVFAEIDGDTLTDDEIFAGFVLMMAAGNDSTKATYTSTMRALMENPDQRRLLVDDLSLVPGAVEEALRMFPAFAHFRRTATKDAELGGCPIKKGDKVALWYPSSNRDEERYENPHTFDVLRNPEHQAFGAGGRHFCLGTALARLELKILVEETVRRFPDMTIASEPTYILSQFSSQLKTLPVKLQG